MTAGDLTATEDDRKLVGNEIDRCLDEAGRRLHRLETGRGSARFDSPQGEAQHYLMRVQLLDRLGIRRAAVYLRTELLEAIAAEAAEEERRKAQPKNVTTLQPDQMITSAARHSVYADMIRQMYNNYPL